MVCNGKACLHIAAVNNTAQLDFAKSPIGIIKLFSINLLKTCIDCSVYVGLVLNWTSPDGLAKGQLELVMTSMASSGIRLSRIHIS